MAKKAPGPKATAQMADSPKAASKPKKLSRQRKPDNLSLDEWQAGLRREHGREQAFRLKNLSGEPIFSEFAVTNPKSLRTYRVAIRGQAAGANFCSCPDFSVNALGTCKHIEWTLAKLERKPGAKKAFAAGFDPRFTEVFLEYGARRRVRFRAGSDCSPRLAKLSSRFFDPAGYLRDDAHGAFDSFVRDARNLGDDVRIYDDALEFVARMRDGDARERAVDNMFPGGIKSPAWNKLLKATLFPYQREGALFAAKAGRCLIADDMGLGKTIQSIAAVEILAKTAGVERVLVVCPAALKYQWKQEIERFATRTAAVIEGFQQGRAAIYRGESFYKIANYDTVHRDIDLIAAWRPDLVILDEAQRIKNWETRRARAIKRIDTPHAIVLTGTPLENRLAELHSIMEFVDRFRLGPLFRFLSEHQIADDAGKVTGYKDLGTIKAGLSPILLRRHKRDVLKDLPGRTDTHLYVDMTAAQKAIHEEHREVVAKIVAKWRRTGFLTEQEQRKMMVSLQYMRMSCNNTFLVDKVTDNGPKIDECAALLDDLLASPGTKIVVFSQWLGTHHLLIRRLDAAKRPYAFYHGSLDGKARKRVLDDFKRNEDCRILLCTESGGVGLNLQEASAVVNMDQPWNPAVLEQRIGRVHRLGQGRNVQVYHFVSRDTIEHGMLGVLKFKASLSEGVLDGGESEIFLGGSKMKLFMESVEKVSGAIPQHVPTLEETGDAPGAESTEIPAAGEETREAAHPAGAAQSPWDGLVAAGIGLMGKLAAALQANASAATTQAPLAAPYSGLIVRDGPNGEPALRIPLPDPETAKAISDLLENAARILRGIAEK